MGDAERTLIHEALRFAVWAAGEGIAPVDGEPARDPEEFLFEYSTETDDGDWETLPERIIDALEAQNERLRKALEAATGLLRRVPGALNSEFSAGMEEREGGSENRQEKLLQASEALRRDIGAFIARRALEGGK